MDLNGCGQTAKPSVIGRGDLHLAPCCGEWTDMYLSEKDEQF